jgi:hypothetical protein
MIKTKGFASQEDAPWQIAAAARDVATRGRRSAVGHSAGQQNDLPTRVEDPRYLRPAF